MGRIPASGTVDLSSSTPLTSDITALFTPAVTAYNLTVSWSSIERVGEGFGAFGVSVLNLPSNNTAGFVYIPSSVSAATTSITQRISGLTVGATYVLSANAIASPGSSFTVKGFSASVQAVPGPEAGAGIGALTLGGAALYLKRRRKDEKLAA